MLQPLGEILCLWYINVIIISCLAWEQHLTLEWMRKGSRGYRLLSSEGS